jgi:hypothetical protein
MPILKHPNSGRISPGAMTTHMWGAAVDICPTDSSAAAANPPSRNDSAMRRLNVKTELEDVTLRNLHSIRPHNLGSGKLTFVAVNNLALAASHNTSRCTLRMSPTPP